MSGFDFIYLPMDFCRDANLGYAFVNLCRSAHGDHGCLEGPEPSESISFQDVLIPPKDHSLEALSPPKVPGPVPRCP